jgi:hypothetical protein
MPDLDPPHLTIAPPAEVVILSVDTCLNIDAERVLTGAAGRLASVVVVGFDHEGELYFAANEADARDVLWKLELARHRLMCSGHSPNE